MSAPRVEAKKYKHDIIEVHVDSCAQMGSTSIHAVQALGNLYDAVREDAIKRRQAKKDAKGYKRLVYVETEQGLREKTDRTNQAMWQKLGSPNTIYNNFLEINGGRVQIHPTQFCKAFEHEFTNHIYPTMVEPVLGIMDDMYAKVQEKAFTIIQKNDPAKLNEYGIEKPADIRLEFYDKKTERDGEVKIKPRVRGLQITIKAKSKDETRDAVWMAIEEVFNDKDDKKSGKKKEAKKKESWESLIEEKSDLFSSENAKRGSFVEMLRQYRQLGAVAAQLAFALEPEHMKQAGYEKSPLAHLGEKQFDPVVIKEHVHLFPNFSLKAHPLSDLPDNSKHAITMQALRLSGFWPWSRKKHMHEDHKARLDKTHRNRADYAILDYFMSNMPEKPDADRRALVVVTHDAPLIQEFAEFSTGQKYSQQKGRDEQGRVDVVKPLAQHDYEFTQPDGKTIIKLPVRDPKKLPPHAALTGREFVEFVAHELNEVQERYDSEHRPPVAIREAMDDAQAALKHLKAAAARDKLPDSLVREGVIVKKIVEAKPHEVTHRDLGGGVMEIGRGGGR